MPNAPRLGTTTASRKSPVRLALPAALLLVWLGPAPPATAQSPVQIARVDHPPALDGTLRDPVWRRATVFTDFRTMHPHEGREPS
jgi:hypothetical protein